MANGDLVRLFCTENIYQTLLGDLNFRPQERGVRTLPLC